MFEPTKPHDGCGCLLTLFALAAFIVLASILMWAIDYFGRTTP